MGTAGVAVLSGRRLLQDATACRWSGGRKGPADRALRSCFLSSLAQRRLGRSESRHRDARSRRLASPPAPPAPVVPGRRGSDRWHTPRGDSSCARVSVRPSCSGVRKACRRFARRIVRCSPARPRRALCVPARRYGITPTENTDAALDLADDEGRGRPGDPGRPRGEGVGGTAGSRTSNAPEVHARRRDVELCPEYRGGRPHGGAHSGSLPRPGRASFHTDGVEP